MTLERPERAGALRNRQKVLDAARACFTEPGADTGMAAIAARAGVGVGTLYRGFGDRGGLVAAVYRDMSDELIETADRLAAEQSPARALTVWLTTYVEQLVAKRSIAAELEPVLAAEPELLESSRRDVAAALEPLLRGAQAQGAIRSDVHAIDIVYMLGGISTPAVTPPAADVVLDIVLRGIRHAPSRSRRTGSGSRTPGHRARPSSASE